MGETKLIFGFRLLVFAAFSVWFGGFTFYTAAVIPIGTEFLGSSRTQGFVTQQVTDVLNLIGLITLLLGLVDLTLFRRRRSTRINLTYAIVWTILVVGLIVLFWIHPMLDSMLEPEHEHVIDDTQFYQIHRLYLWVSTVQWLACWVWLGILIQATILTGEKIKKDQNEN